MWFEFGRHRGKHVSDIPTAYLCWCLNECRTLRGWQRIAIEDELRARGESSADPEPDPPAADDEPVRQQTLSVVVAPVLRQWRQEMVRRFYPDRGGSHEAMVAINIATERLRELVEAA